MRKFFTEKVSGYIQAGDFSALKAVYNVYTFQSNVKLYFVCPIFYRKSTVVSSYNFGYKTASINGADETIVSYGGAQSSTDLTSGSYLGFFKISDFYYDVKKGTIIRMTLNGSATTPDTTSVAYILYFGYE